MADNIPQYTSAYTPEENRVLHERMERANEAELVDMIFMLRDLFPDEERKWVVQELNQFIGEITHRYQAWDRYQKLKGILEEWSQYFTGLLLYHDALKVRMAYQQYIKESLEAGKKKPSIENFMLNKSEELSAIGRNDDTLRQCLAGEDTKKGIKCPEPPKHYYEHLSDVPVEDYTPHESLEKLGKETLKELLVLLLQNVDNEGNDNIAPILIRFSARIYSRQNKKGKEKATPFSTDIKSDPELREICKTQLEKHRECKADCDQQRASISQASQQLSQFNSEIGH